MTARAWPIRLAAALVVLALAEFLPAADADPTAAFQAAVAAVAAQQWPEADAQLAIAARAWPDHPRVRLLQGISAWHGGRMVEAIDHLQVCQASEEPAIRSRSLYYLVVAHLAQEDRDAAGQALQRLLGEHPASGEADRVRRQFPEIIRRHAPAPKEGWQVDAVVAGLYDDNPAQLRDNEIIQSRPDADLAMRVALQGAWSDAAAQERYALHLAVRRYREAEVLDSVAVGQRIGLFAGGGPDLRHECGLASRLYWLDGAITQHVEELAWTSRWRPGLQQNLSLQTVVAIDDFLQERNEDLDARRVGLRATWRWRSNSGLLDHVHLGLGLSYNDTQSGTYDRWWSGLDGLVGWRLGEQVDFTFDGHWAMARFPAITIADGTRREDQHWGAGARLAWRWSAPGSLFAELRADGRASNDDLFDFDRFQAVLGWHFSL